MQQHLFQVAKYWFQIVRDGLPGMVASVAGAVVISYLHWGAPPAPAVVQPAAVNSDVQVVRMIHDEHELIVDFLKKEQATREAEEASKFAPAKSRVELHAEPRVAAAALPAVKTAAKEPVKTKPVLLPAQPAPAVVTMATFESGPLVAPESDPDWKTTVLHATRLPDVADFVLDIPSRVGRTMIDVLPIHRSSSRFVQETW